MPRQGRTKAPLEPFSYSHGLTTVGLVRVSVRGGRRAHEVLLGVLLLSGPPPGLYSVCVLVARRLIIQHQQERVFIFHFVCVFGVCSR